MWSPEAENVVRRLMAAQPAEPRGPVGIHADRLGALSIGGSMWTDCYLRPEGEVVIVGEDEDRPDEVTAYSDRPRLLGILVYGSRRYPELAGLLPRRGPDAIDCWCVGHPVLGPGRVICPDCGSMGWVKAERDRSDPTA